MDAEDKHIIITDAQSADKYIQAVYERQWMQTADRVEIVAGLQVFTYDYKWGTVDQADFERVQERNKEYKDRGEVLTSNDFWFDVIYPDGQAGLYNGERMTTKCPRCYEGYDKCHLNKKEN